MTGTTRSPRNTSSDGTLRVNRLVRGILERAEMPKLSAFTADEAAHWPKGALERFVAMGILREVEPAEEVRCNECEEGCWIKPRIRDDPRTSEAVGTYFCRRNKDIGRFKVDLSRARRWEFSLGGLAKAVSKAAKPTGKVTELVPERLAMLGTVKLDGKNRELFLARGAAWPDAQVIFGGAVRLKTASHPVILTLAGMPLGDLLSGVKNAVRPLVEIADFDGKVLHIPLQGAFPEVAPSPWADIPNEPITLDQFMVKYCEKRSKEARKYRRLALQGAARNRPEQIKLPPEAGQFRSGQSKKYFVHDLLKSWQDFLDENLDLPPLLSQYRR